MTHNPPEVSRGQNHYRQLLGEVMWEKLHPAVQRRFSDNQTAQYEGIMNRVYLSRFGRFIAMICRLFGNPLSSNTGQNIPITVRVYFNTLLGGYTWERCYRFGSKVERVTSTKCITRSGLIECLGRGVGMQLEVSEYFGGLQFTSRDYFWQWRSLRIRLPSLLSPGKTVVRQRAIDNHSFRFDLELTHPLFGCVAKQNGVFSPSVVSMSTPTESSF